MYADAAVEKAARRWRTENQMSPVNKRRNNKNRKAESLQRTSKRGCKHTWLKDQA
jgi:IS5 family transposase